MAQLHLVTIVVLEVVIDILGRIEVHAVLISKDTNLDLGSVARANGSSVVRLATVIIGIVDHTALQKVGGIIKAIVFHVLNLLAVVVASVAVNSARPVVVRELSAVTAILITIVFVTVVFLSVGIFVRSGVTTVVACFTHVLLVLLHVLNSGLEVSLKVDKVLSVVVVARRARIVGAQAKDGETLRGKDSVGSTVIVLGSVSVVRLDKLTLLELDRVRRNVNLVFRVLVKATELTSGSLFGALHKLAHVSRLGVVLALGSKGIGRNDSGQNGKGGEKLHVENDILQEKREKKEKSEKSVT
jgi:hypothetical protein